MTSIVTRLHLIPVYIPENRLVNFIVGLTMTHPNNCPHHPEATTSVVSYLRVCFQYPGPPDLVYIINCTQPASGRFLVITIEAHVKMPIAEVIVNSKCKYTSLSPGRRQAIICTSAGMLLIEQLETNQ